MNGAFSDSTGYGFRQMGSAEADAECYKAMQEDAAAARATSAAVAISPQKSAFQPPLAAANTPDAPEGEIDPELDALLKSLSRPDEPTASCAITAPAFDREAPSVTASVTPAEVKFATPSGVNPDCATDFGAFPVRDLTTLRQYDNALDAMHELCRQLLKDKDYAKVRDDYCHLSIRLNLIGKLAPAFRPQLKPGATLNSPVYHQINRDQVVIDLHWCHATRMPLMPKDIGHAALLCEATDFSFDSSWTLASMKWKKTYRAAEAMCLTSFQQCQMLVLRGTELEARIKSLDSGWRASKGKSTSKIAMATKKIAEWADRDERILNRRDDYLKLWLARELLGRSSTPQQLAKLHALMTNSEVKDRKTIRERLQRLDKHVELTP